MIELAIGERRRDLGNFEVGRVLPFAKRLPTDYPERAIHVTTGAVEVDGQGFEAGQMLVFASGQPVVIRALEPSIVMALGGEPIGPRFIDRNFVSSSQERIEQAKADWRAGRMKLPDLDHDDFVLLPPEPGAPANPVS